MSTTRYLSNKPQHFPLVSWRSTYGAIDTTGQVYPRSAETQQQMCLSHLLGPIPNIRQGSARQLPDPVACRGVRFSPSAKRTVSTHRSSTSGDLRVRGIGCGLPIRSSLMSGKNGWFLQVNLGAGKRRARRLQYMCSAWSWNREHRSNQWRLMFFERMIALSPRRRQSLSFPVGIHMKLNIQHS